MKQNIIKFIFVFFVVLPSTFASDYYVKNDGDDTKDGLSIANAWETISKVNGHAQSPNDTVHFDGLGTWRERLVLDAGDITGYVTYTSYGTGKALLLGSVERNDTSSWTTDGGNIWYDDTAFAHDIGILIFDNEDSVGTKYSTSGALSSQGDFYVNGSGILYIYSVSNPASYYSDIECGQYGSGLVGSTSMFIPLSSYNIVSNLDVRYFGANGMGGHDISHVIVRDCDFSYGGGCYLSGTTRFGNGIEVGNTLSDILVERNTFNQIYDEAFTNQSTAGTHTDITYKNNIYSNCWFGMSSSVPNQDNIIMECNTCVNPSSCWSANQRSTGSGAESPARCIMFSVAPSNASYIRGNIMYDTGSNVNSHLLKFGTDTLTKYRLDYNCYYKPSNAMIATDSDEYTQAQYSTWLTDYNKDTNSVNADPVLDDNTYGLQSTSPCISAGIFSPVVTYDYSLFKRPQGTGYDIGAKEYRVGTEIEGVTLNGVTIE